jgi:hypothetical protein
MQPRRPPAAVVRRALRAVPLLALTLATAAHADAALDVSAAFDGWSRPGRQSELRLELGAGAGGRAQLSIDDGARRIETTLVLQSGAPALVRLPVTAGERVHVVVVRPAAPALVREFGFRLAEAPLIAWASRDSSAWPQELGLQRLPVDATALPHSAAGFAGIDALVLDEATLLRLEPEQLRALAAYLGACGRVVAVSAAGAALKQVAGCGGGALRIVATTTAAPRALAALFEQPVAEPPRFEVLAHIAEPGLGAWPTVAAVVTVYLAAMLALAAADAGARTLILLSLLATVLVAALPGIGRAPAQLAVWAELAPGDLAARYGASLSLPGSFAGDRTLTLDAVLPAAEPCAAAGRPGGPSIWTWDRGAQRFTAVAERLPLFGSERVCFRGVFPVAARAARIGRAGDALAVTNVGQGAWERGRALLQGRVYDLPPLAPGESARLVEPRLPQTDAETLALSRSSAAGSILWPLAMPPLSARRVAGWLSLQIAAPTGAPP